MEQRHNEPVENLPEESLGEQTKSHTVCAWGHMIAQDWTLSFRVSIKSITAEKESPQVKWPTEYDPIRLEYKDLLGQIRSMK